MKRFFFYRSTPLRSGLTLTLMTLAVIAVPCLPVYGAERITLRNGFEFDCARREAVGDRVLSPVFYLAAGPRALHCRRARDAAASQGERPRTPTTSRLRPAPCCVWSRFPILLRRRLQPPRPRTASGCAGTRA